MAKSQQHFVNLSQFTQPIVEESPSREWVDIEVNTYLGRVRYYDYLIERYRNSPTNMAVLNNVIKLVYGEGLTARDASLKSNDFARFMSLLSKDDLKSVITDYCILGTGAMEVIKNKKGIVSISHVPRNLIQPEKCDEYGDIKGYYFSNDWDEINKYPPVRLDSFGNGKDKEILVFGSYSIGRKYIYQVDYEAILDYAYLEEKVAEYLNMDVETSFSGVKIINFNNGESDEEAQRQIIKNTTAKLLGTKGVKTIFSFNESEENKTTIDDISLDNAAEHYSYLSREAQNKILAGHNVTSHMLVGITDGNQGFSSNADEIKTASEYFYSTTISHKQQVILDALKKIAFNNEISLDLQFKRSKIFKDEPKKEVEMSLKSHDEILSNEFINKSSELGEDWVLVDSSPVNYETEAELDAHLMDLNKPKLSAIAKLKRLVSTGTARPNASSEVDGELFKSRYRYTGAITQNSREFCKKMIAANKIYRKEDIIAMGNKVVNEGWNQKGMQDQGYSIWFFKGGGGCGHVWTRETWAKKSDVNNPNAQQFTPAQTRKAGEILPTADSKVYTRPRDMPKRGFLNR